MKTLFFFLFFCLLQSAGTHAQLSCEGGVCTELRSYSAEREAFESAGLTEDSYYVFVYDGPPLGSGETSSCQLSEETRLSLPRDASIFHLEPEERDSFANLGLLLENAADIHLVLSPFALRVLRDADLDLSRVRRRFLHTCGENVQLPAGWTRIDTPEDFLFSALGPSVQLVTPFDSAESCNAGASDGREYPDASALSIALGFSEAPGAQHANRQLKVTVGRFSNRSTTLDTWPIVLWELTVSDAGAGAEGCAPLWAALVTEEGAGPASEEWVLGEALEGGGCEYRLRPTGWLYKLQRQYLGLWEDGPGREGGGVALAVEEVRSTGAISLAVGQPFTLCSVARRGGLFRSMRAECVPPGKRRGAARREGGLEARRAAVLAGCGEVCELGEAVPGAPLGFVAKRVDCAALWGNAALDEETDFWPPPPAVPELLAGDFSRGGALRTRQGEVRLDAAWGDEGERVWSASWVEQLVASFRASPAFFASSYGAEDKAALREGVRRAGVRGAGVLVVGSSFPWVESLLAEPPALFRAPLAEGAEHVTTLDYLPVRSEHPRVTALVPAEARDRYLQGRFGPFDGVVSYSSVEHSGLGRYGDGINPWGDVQTIARAWCVAAEGAFMLLGVPTVGECGQSREEGIEWNNGRLYGERTLPDLAANWRAEWRTPNCTDQPLFLFRREPAPP